MAAPTSLRLDDPVTARLASYVARHPGVSRASVAARLVDEGLRMEEHPGVVFRDGPAGRRAVLVGGPDVWEVVWALRSARRAEPDLAPDELVSLVEDNTGVPARQVRTALDYWGAYPDDVDALVDDAERREAEWEATVARTTDLLGR